MRCAVVGAGAWGTALAQVLAKNGHDVLLWAFEPDVADAINLHRENTRFLTGVKLAESLRATTDISQAVGSAEMVVFATPSHVIRRVARSAADRVPRGAPVVIASKGIETDTLALMTDVAEEELPGRPVVALSGPSFAAEVAAGQPTAVVIAARFPDIAERAQQAFSSGTFRTYTHDDVTGVEIGGSLKNVMAVATGIADGLGLGFNARAALITRGLAEMTRLGVALGASPQTFAGLAGLGDLVLTCTGSLSRNRTVGVEVGRGRRLDEVLSGRDTVAEGVITTRNARALAKRERVEMPIVETVYRVLFEDEAPRNAIASLMERELRAETD